MSGISEELLRDLIQVIKTFNTVSESGEYCFRCMSDGISQSMINDLMHEEKKVDNFGLHMDDLKSLKSALSIY